MSVKIKRTLEDMNETLGEISKNLNDLDSTMVRVETVIENMPDYNDVLVQIAKSMTFIGKQIQRSNKLKKKKLRKTRLLLLSSSMSSSSSLSASSVSSLSSSQSTETRSDDKQSAKKDKPEWSVWTPATGPPRSPVHPFDYVL